MSGGRKAGRNEPRRRPRVSLRLPGTLLESLQAERAESSHGTLTSLICARLRGKLRLRRQLGFQDLDDLSRTLVRLNDQVRLMHSSELTPAESVLAYLDLVEPVVSRLDLEPPVPLPEEVLDASCSFRLDADLNRRLRRLAQTLVLPLSSLIRHFLSRRALRGPRDQAAYRLLVRTNANLQQIRTLAETRRILPALPVLQTLDRIEQHLQSISAQIGGA